MKSTQLKLQLRWFTSFIQQAHVTQRKLTQHRLKKRIVRNKKVRRSEIVKISGSYKSQKTRDLVTLSSIRLTTRQQWVENWTWWILQKGLKCMEERPTSRTWPTAQGPQPLTRGHLRMFNVTQRVLRNCQTMTCMALFQWRVRGELTLSGLRWAIRKWVWPKTSIAHWSRRQTNSSTSRSRSAQRKQGNKRPLIRNQTSWAHSLTTQSTLSIETQAHLSCQYWIKISADLTSSSRGRSRIGLVNATHSKQWHSRDMTVRLIGWFSSATLAMKHSISTITQYRRSRLREMNLLVQDQLRQSAWQIP